MVRVECLRFELVSGSPPPTPGSWFELHSLQSTYHLWTTQSLSPSYIQSYCISICYTFFFFLFSPPTHWKKKTKPAFGVTRIGDVVGSVVAAIVSLNVCVTRVGFIGVDLIVVGENGVGNVVRTAIAARISLNIAGTGVGVSGVRVTGVGNVMRTAIAVVFALNVAVAGVGVIGVGVIGVDLVGVGVTSVGNDTRTAIAAVIALNIAVTRVGVIGVDLIVVIGGGNVIRTTVAAIIALTAGVHREAGRHNINDPLGCTNTQLSGAELNVFFADRVADSDAGADERNRRVGDYPDSRRQIVGDTLHRTTRLTTELNQCDTNKGG
ncbi:hypothetical protein HOY82DRAFT_534906 [Tuber indicum]|nr:hypothetical protein HOY82DRAFT_534906 [Tuber indicum]